MGILQKLFGAGTKVDYKELVNNGAIIVDVRTKGEYSTGAIPGSLNIPLNNISGNLPQLKDKNQTIITCCASGMRSGSAKAILKSKGYKNVHNGGGWFSLANKID